MVVPFLQEKGPPKHLKITVHYEEKGKSHARPSAFMEILSATPAGCSNSIVGSPAAAFLKALAGLIPQGAWAGPQAVAPKPDREVNARLDWLSRLFGERQCKFSGKLSMTVLAGANHIFKEVLVFPITTYTSQFHDAAL